MLLRNKMSKRILCLAVSIVLLLSFSMSVFAATVTETKTVSVTNYITIYTYNNSSVTSNDVLSSVSSVQDYNSDGFTGTLSYSHYYVASSRNVYGGIYENSVGVVYSGSVTRTTYYADTKTQTSYNTISIYSTSDQLANQLSSYQGSSISYNDAHYSGNLYYQGYSIVSEQYVYSSVKYYQISLIYSGTVSFHQ